MAEDDQYLSVNRANWDSRVPHHEAGYGLDRYRQDPTALSGVVRFDLPRLGDVAGRRGVHLQCHIGTDTVSLARLGALMTGLDFSTPALEVARRLAADCAADIDYVEGDLYGAVDTLGRERYEFVYTGIGALCWLPDVRRWAQVVADLLEPGGRLFIREGHPVLWTMSDPRPDGLLVMEYPYFEVPGGTQFTETVSYVEHDGVLSAPDTIQYNHGLGEIINAVMDAGLTLTAFDEHRSVPWNPLGDAMVEGPDEEWTLRTGGERIPLSYTLQASKPLR